MDMENKTNKNKNGKEVDENTIWVQCENPMCMKWRKIPKDFCDDYSDVSWYCYMNPNKEYNDCDVEQEKMHVPKGQTVVFSELDVGSLVWAKMAGYPRWPGIISPDPCYDTEMYIIRYEDGTNDPKYYHIEFLGEPHSHAWVSARFVELYNTSTVDLSFIEKSMKGKVTKANFQKSLSEAAQLFTLDAKHRLLKCIYKHSKPAVKASNALLTNQIQKKRKENYTVKSKHQSNKISEVNTGESSVTDKSTQNNGFVNINGRMYPVVFPIQPTVDCFSVNNKPLNYIKSKKRICGVVNPIVRTNPTKKILLNADDTTSLKNSQENEKNKKRLRKENIEKRSKKLKSCKENKKPNVECKIDASKTNTKGGNNKEAAVIDDTSNRNNKEAAVIDEDIFWKLYHSFCIERNMDNNITHLTWYNKTIDLFTIYKKVQFMGGYKQATSHWEIWRSICWDVIGTQVDSQFTSLKKAYRQVLLPFERSQDEKKGILDKTAIMCSNVSNRLPQNSIPGAAILSNTLQPISSSQLCSPVYNPQHNLLLNKLPTLTSPSQVVPTSVVVGPVPVDFLLNGVLPSVPLIIPQRTYVLPSVPLIIPQGIGDLPSSNPQSPYDYLVSPGVGSLSDIGYDIALEELDSLEQQLQNILCKSSQSSNFISSQSSNIISSQRSESVLLFDDVDDSYQPILGSQNVDELSDVLGELTDLEDTLLEMAGDILSTGSQSDNLNKS